MSDFRTKLLPRPADLQISYGDPVLSMGSCFAEHIGGLLARSKFPILLNPFGILYDPISLGRSLQRVLSGAPYVAGDLFQHEGLWHSFGHHGRFSHPEREEALAGINRSLAEAVAFLPAVRRLLLTLGTARVFVARASGSVVANCHKLPVRQFERRRLSVGEVVEALEPPLREWHARQAGLAVILTLSPVRHLRDGMIENQRSKATLLLAIDELERRLPFVHYFPASELMLDDLRDYRFYGTDLVHPNELAIEYIWQHFQSTYFSSDTREILRRVNQLVTASGHRPFHPETENHQRFLQKQLAGIDALEKAYPFIDLSSERAFFERQLKRNRDADG